MSDKDLNETVELEEGKRALSDEQSSDIGREEQRPGDGVQTPAEPQKLKRNKYATEKKKKKKLPTWSKIVIWLVVISLIIAGAAAIINKLISKDAGPVYTEMAYYSPLASYVYGYSYVSPRETAEYGADIKGVVQDVLVSQGDMVHPGDLLFTIDPSELGVELLKAQQTLRTIEKQLKELVGDGSNAVCSAPFSGRLIEATELKTGDIISAGTKVGILVDDHNLKITLYFNYGYKDSVKPGMSAMVSIPESMAQVSGTVSKVYDVKVPVDGIMCFKADITFTNPGSLTKGLSAAGSITDGSQEILPVGFSTVEYGKEEALIFKGNGELTYSNIVDYGYYSSGETICAIDEEDMSYEINELERQYDEALKEVTKLQSLIENTGIVSEISGMVSGIMIKPGDRLTASGTPVVSVYDTSSLVLEVNIDERDIGKVKVGMPVQLNYESSSEGGGFAMGEITYVSFEAKVDNSGWGAVATFPATISFVNDGTLLPGMGVNFTITAEVKDHCLTVPTQSVIYTEMTDPETGEFTASTVVYVKNSNPIKYDEAKMPEGAVIPEGFYPVAVTAGLSDDTRVEIISGIEEGTEVYAGIQKDGGMYYGGGMMMY